MKWLDRFRRRLARVIAPAPAVRPSSAPVAVTRQRRSTRPLYTGRGSGTRDKILRILSDGQWRTRDEISARLDVTTAAIHLPRMVEDGLLLTAWRGRRMVYMAAVTPPQPAPATNGTAPGLPPSGETDGPQIAPEAV